MTSGPITGQQARPPGRGRRPHAVRDTAVCVWGGTGTQRKASDPPTLGPPTLLSHILCPEAASPSPSSLRLQSKMGNAQSVGPGVEGGGPASKPQSKVKGTLFVLSGTLAHTFRPSLLPKAAPGLLGGNLQGWGILRGNSSSQRSSCNPRPR